MLTAARRVVSPAMTSWLIYGAYGFTGELVARRAVAAGARPVLAGRDASQLEPLARELDLEWRTASLDDPRALSKALEGVSVVAHCAGPFSGTAEPMVDACLAAGVHYLDITGEIAVLEAVHARDEEARAAGVVLLPGAGFDVVPSDCLLAMTAAELPGSTTLELAFRSRGGISRGTSRSALESIGSPPLARRGGVIGPIERDARQLTVTFGERPTQVSAISWGDVATAFHSTGIGNVATYTQLPRGATFGMMAARKLARLPLGGRLMHAALERAVRRMPNPSAESMANGGVELWARARDGKGRSVERRMRTPDGYLLTADSVTRIAAHLGAGTLPAGAHTPSSLLGPRFALELDRVSLVD
jgi:short subunit dehydrogenase-like uncharacterized protein